MLVVENVKKYFGEVRAVDGVSFSISQGEIVSLVGSNGAGKTTLVNLISGYLPPDSGRIRFAERDITYSSAYNRIKHGVARSFQVPSLFENISVYDNVRISLLVKHGKTKNGILPADRYSDIKNETETILEIFGLIDKSSLTPRDLSEGDRKVLDVAIAFALRPKLLLLDEPTSGVATNDKFKVMNVIIEAMQRDGISGIVIEHDMDIVADCSKRVLVMHEGKIIADGEPSEVMENEKVKEVVLGKAGNPQS